MLRTARLSVYFSLYLVIGLLVPLIISTPGYSNGDSTPSGAPDAVVTLTDMLTFDPYDVVIRAGQTVEWKNGSVLVHTVTADPGLAANKKDIALPEGAKPFNSGNMEPGGVFSHKFTVPGTYKYFCIPHEGASMVGVVTVKPAAHRR